MRVITTDLTVKKINKRMKNKGFTGHKSTMSDLVRVYVNKKTGKRLMIAFQRKIDKYKATAYTT